MWGWAWATTSVYLACVKLIYWQRGYRWTLHDGTVPIPPLCHTWSTSGSHAVFSSTTAIELVWAVTIHKAQGLTLNKLCVEGIFHRPHICCDLLRLANLCGEPFNNKRKSHCMSQKQLYSIISAFINLASLSSVVSICLLNLSRSLLFLSLSFLVAM